jgi:hypothetical protein
LSGTPSIALVNTDQLTGYYTPATYELMSYAIYLHVELLGAEVCSQEVSNSYTQELTGFFVPPVSANYSFYVYGDDW